MGTVILPSGKVIRSIERPWLNNRPNISCIPEGVYPAKWLERSGSGRYKRVWHVTGVPGRSGILFHVGNLVRHSRGCILPGMKWGKLEGVSAVLSSGSALSAMRSELSGKPFRLVVVGNRT